MLRTGHCSLNSLHEALFLIYLIVLVIFLKLGIVGSGVRNATMINTVSFSNVFSRTLHTGRITNTTQEE